MPEYEYGMPVWVRLSAATIEALDEWARQERRKRAAQMAIIIEDAITARKVNEREPVEPEKSKAKAK